MTNVIEIPVQIKDALNGVNHDVAKSKRRWPDAEWSEVRRADIDTLLNWVEEVTGLKESRLAEEAEGRDEYAKAQAVEAQANWDTLDAHAKAGWVRFAKNEKSNNANS